METIKTNEGFSFDIGVDFEETIKNNRMPIFQEYYVLRLEPEDFDVFQCSLKVRIEMPDYDERLLFRVDGGRLVDFEDGFIVDGYSDDMEKNSKVLRPYVLKWIEENSQMLIDKQKKFLVLYKQYIIDLWNRRSHEISVLEGRVDYIEAREKAIQNV